MFEYSITLGPKVVLALGVLYSLVTIGSFWLIYMTVKMVVEALGKELKDLL